MLDAEGGARGEIGPGSGDLGVQGGGGRRSRGRLERPGRPGGALDPGKGLGRATRQHERQADQDAGEIAEGPEHRSLDHVEARQRLGDAATHGQPCLDDEQCHGDDRVGGRDRRKRWGQAHRTRATGTTKVAARPIHG